MCLNISFTAAFVSNGRAVEFMFEQPYHGWKCLARRTSAISPTLSSVIKYSRTSLRFLVGVQPLRGRPIGFNFFLSGVFPWSCEAFFRFLSAATPGLVAFVVDVIWGVESGIEGLAMGGLSRPLLDQLMVSQGEAFYRSSNERSGTMNSSRCGWVAALMEQASRAPRSLLRSRSAKAAFVEEDRAIWVRLQKFKPHCAVGLRAFRACADKHSWASQGEGDGWRGRKGE